MNDYQNYEEEIDLIDLIFFFMKKWRGLLAALLLGVLLGGGLYLIKDQEAKQLEQERSEEGEKLDLEDAAAEIGSEALEKMEVAYQYHQLYKKQKSYNEKSMIMKLDPNAVYTGTLSYYVAAGDDTELISMKYKNLLWYEETLEKLQEVSGLDCEIPYLRELLKSWTEDEIDVSLDQNKIRFSDDMETVLKHSFIVYQVTSTSQESTERMLDMIREEVEVQKADCREEYADCQIVEVKSYVNLTADSSYFDKQRANVDRLNSYLSSTQNMEKGFSTKEKAYYNKKYLASNGVEDEEVHQTEPIVAPVSKGKWLAVGMAAAILLWGAYYTVRYLADRRIKTASELHSTYGLPLIGQLVTEEKQGNRVDALIQTLQNCFRTQPDSMEYVLQAVETLKEDSLILCGDPELPEVDSVMKRLTAQCHSLEKASFCSKSCKALEKAKAAGHVILIVSVGKTVRSELERELEICKLQKIQVDGVIAIEH